ncbi:MAG TPA: hypothetical protein VF526_06025 [Solirubrobacteraceae bacterium]
MAPILDDACGPQLSERLATDRLEAQLVEVAQAPGGVVTVVPDRDGASDELVAAGPSIPYTHRKALPMPTALAGIHVRAGWSFVMTSRCPRIQRDRDRRGHVDVAESQYELRGAVDDLAHLVLPANPLMRRMNSMLSGHHGVFARTVLTAGDRAHRMPIFDTWSRSATDAPAGTPSGAAAGTAAATRHAPQPARRRARDPAPQPAHRRLRVARSSGWDP